MHHLFKLMLMHAQEQNSSYLWNFIFAKTYAFKSKTEFYKQPLF